MATDRLALRLRRELQAVLASSIALTGDGLLPGAATVWLRGV